MRVSRNCYSGKISRVKRSVLSMSHCHVMNDINPKKKVNMADEEFDESIEKIKDTVRKAFVRVYATLKARELKTLRQLDALRKHCEDNKDLKRNCVQNIHINFNNESNLINSIKSFGDLDLEKLNFDSDTFILEDYVSPNDDHMYMYKTIEELTEDDKGHLEIIEKDALKQITSTKDCVCQVHIRNEDVSKQLRDTDNKKMVPSSLIDPTKDQFDKDKLEQLEQSSEEDKSDSSGIDIKKIEPTEDWMNTIKNQTETEPSQVADVMEHSTIVCS